MKHSADEITININLTAVDIHLSVFESPCRNLIIDFHMILLVFHYLTVNQTMR